MAFVKNLAKGGLFGLSGLAATGAFNSKNKSNNAPQSLVTGDYPTAVPTNPSLLSTKPGYLP